MKKLKLEQWSVVDRATLQDYRNLVPGQRLSGQVFRRFGLPRGTMITATITAVDRARGRVETANAVYRLGAISAAYQRWLGEEAEGAGHLQQAVAGLAAAPVLR